MKPAIVIIGDRQQGKSSIVRALTGGHGVCKLWNIQDKNGNKKKALIIVSSAQERSCSPQDFPDKFENDYKINRASYDILIATLQFKFGRQNSYERYIEQLQIKGFDVKVAVITRDMNGNVSHKRIQEIKNYINGKGFKFIELDTSNDHHTEAKKVRDAFYP